MSRKRFEYTLGDIVSVTGVVIGRSEFQKGEPTFLVEFERKGASHREWFRAADFDRNHEQEGGEA